MADPTISGRMESQGEIVVEPLNLAKDLPKHFNA